MLLVKIVFVGSGLVRPRPSPWYCFMSENPHGGFGIYRYGLCTYTSEVGVESDLTLVGIRTWCHSIDVAAHGFFVGL